MADCCDGKDITIETSPTYKRALWAVIFINAGLFVTEVVTGAMAGSLALAADALDFAADATTYGISLWALNKALRTRAKVALIKGVSLAVMAGLVLGAAIFSSFQPRTPTGEVMSIVGIAALAANALSVLILLRWRDGDANVRSVWLCSRNDAIGNVAVIGAGMAVVWFASPWPDLIVAVLLAGLFLRSSVEVIRRARAELRDAAFSPASA